MPTYEYVCPAGHEFEKFQKMSARPGARCPVCKRPAVRQISGGAGLVFKGSGFYITDYPKSGSGSDGAKGKASESSPASDTGDSKSKPAASEGTSSESSTTKSEAAKTPASPSPTSPKTGTNTKT